MTIYVENLHCGIDEEQLKQLFFSFGRVQATSIVKDAVTGVSIGSGYVQMESVAARAAILRLHGFIFRHLQLTVTEVPEKEVSKTAFCYGAVVIVGFRFSKN